SVEGCITYRDALLPTRPAGRRGGPHAGDWLHEPASRPHLLHSLAEQELVLTRRKAPEATATTRVSTCRTLLAGSRFAGPAGTQRSRACKNTSTSPAPRETT